MANYVNNADFLKALIEYKKEKNVNPDAPIPEYIGRCIYEIATRFSRRPNFINYSYREEMIGDAIENCIMYLDNFDPEKSSNPFAYFTQFCYYAFIRRITAEKTQSYIKHLIVRDINADIMSFSSDADGEFADSQEIAQNMISYIQAHNEFDTTFFESMENKKAAKRKRKKKEGGNLDDLFDDEKALAEKQ